MKTLTLLAPCFAAALAAFGCETNPTGPSQTAGHLSAAVVQNDRFTLVDGVANNDCTGEIILFHVTIHLLSSVTADSAGGLHVSFDANSADSHGTSLITGINYISNETFHERFDATAGSTETFLLQFTLLSQGNAPNEVLLILDHVTINPDGTVTSSFDHFKLAC
jgi:hypothetical protein